MRSVGRIALLIAVGALGLFTAGGLAGESRAATSLDGAWSGSWGDGWNYAEHAMQISGTLEGGFKVSAGESWMTFGCPISSGTLLETFSPKGDGTYDETNLGVTATTTQGQEGVKCEYNYYSGTGITVSGNGNSLEISGCASAVCGGLSRVSSPTNDTPPSNDTSPPIVRAFDAGWAYPGQEEGLKYSVKDDSRRATVTITLYNGGHGVDRIRRTNMPATGEQRTIDVRMPAGASGPMYFCLYAQDAAGNRSRNAPRSRCGWISFVVPVSRVSNGCGGAQWGPFWERAQNWLMNRQTYKGFKVSFRDACNVHDAGYGGFSVEDSLHGGKRTDFRKSSRQKVDDKFKADLQQLCEKAITGKTKRGRHALLECREGMSLGNAVAITTLTLGAIPPGARAYHDGVRAYAKAAYDTDPMDWGVQTEAPSVDAYLFGWTRDND